MSWHCYGCGETGLLGVGLCACMRRQQNQRAEQMAQMAQQDRARERYEHFVVETAAQALRALDSAPGLKVRLDAERQRANRLADENGRLLDEVRELKAENSDLRRQVERLERKRGGR